MTLRQVWLLVTVNRQNVCHLDLFFEISHNYEISHNSSKHIPAISLFLFIPFICCLLLVFISLKLAKYFFPPGALYNSSHHLSKICEFLLADHDLKTIIRPPGSKSN